MYLHKCILIGKLQEPTRNTNDYGLASEIISYRIAGDPGEDEVEIFQFYVKIDK